MCKASHEPGGPRRCSGDTRSKVEQSQVAADALEARSKVLRAILAAQAPERSLSDSAIENTRNLLVHCIQIGHNYSVHELTEHCLVPCEIGRSYVDAAGRSQYAVDGPKGTVLVTRPDWRSKWEVWRSDSLTVVAKGADLDRMVHRAVTLSGRGPATALPPGTWAAIHRDHDAE